MPHNWNARDTTLNRSSVGWYRKEFKLPKVPKDELKRTFWKVRFEGSNYRTKVWLNGRTIGGYTGYFPFEADLDGLRKGRNTLVVKVSSVRSNRDLTHWRPAAFNGYGTGGWWNFGGLLREVYVRRIDTIDIEDVHVLPHLRKVGGPAKVEVRAYLRNMTDKAREVDLVIAADGRRIRLAGKRIPANSPRLLTQTFTIKHPRLWEPGDPELYPLSVSVEEDGRERGEYRLRFGVRKLQTARGGVILLNGHRLNVHGASIHEDDLNEGGALSQRTRSLLVSRLRDLGATITRSHYPLHPAFLEAFDKYGILYWVDAPVYQIPNTYFNESGVRAAAKRAVSLTVRNNINHPSIMTWSLANEPAGNRSELGIFGAGLARFIKDAAAEVRVPRRHPLRLDRPPGARGRAADQLGLPLPRRARRQRVLRLVRLLPGRPGAPADHERRAERLPRRGARRQPQPAADDHRVRRRGPARRPRDPARQPPVPAPLHAPAPAHPRLEALRRRLDRVGSARLPRRPDLDRRRAARLGQPALEQQEPDRGVERAQAGLLRPAQALAALEGTALTAPPGREPPGAIQLPSAAA